MSTPVPAKVSAMPKGDFATLTKALTYTPDFDTSLEALAHDPLATYAERILAHVKRNAWGRSSFYAIKKDGSPIWQRDIVKVLGINKRRVSKAIGYLKKRGYLQEELKLLYPVISPSIGDCKKVPPVGDFWGDFLEEWKVSHATDFSAYEAISEQAKVSNDELKRFKKVLLPEFRKWKALRTKARKVREISQSPDTDGLTVQIPTNTSTSTYVQESTTEETPGAESQNPSVEAAILALPDVVRLQTKLKDTLRQPLLGKLAAQFAECGAPVEELQPKIAERWHKFTSLGLLLHCAEDVIKAWNRKQAERRAADATQRQKEAEALQLIIDDPNEPDEIRADCRSKLAELRE